MPWYAIQHKPAQGDRALENLQNQDARCFYPKVTVERIRAGKRATRLEPLFPGYLFINIDESDPLWGKLRSTRGVLRVVGFGGKPVPVPDEVIEYIHDGLTAVEEQGGLKKGEKVRIQEGPFRGVEGIFQAYEGEERAIVLISFMQKQQAVRVRLGDL
ncbi:transcription/translation regulatory transformer protein RfaH [Marinobacter sp.]|uniref:transcription/translation regulatory transformer protein RfaH n=1 Tax=Marinobacter sp. TaxID=50741 RepID=UPI0035662B0B